MENHVLIEEVEVDRVKEAACDLPKTSDGEWAAQWLGFQRRLGEGRDLLALEH
jgi:hypothetical protein